jgi:glycine/D-amino acid oxidase-like deaminating enzyme
VIRNPLDCLIVGQGLAGTTLAWQARAAGLSVAVVDRGDRASASRIAAGLVTPVTGKRMVKSWRLDELHPFAVAFYRRIESETGESFYHTTAIVRAFATEREREVFEIRAATEFHNLTRKPNPPLDPNWFTAPLGEFEMPAAGRLDVPHYLDVSRERLDRDGQFLAAELNPDELEVGADLLRIPRLDLKTRYVVFCTGFDGGANPRFRHVQFNPAKGEILTLRIPGLYERRVVNRGIWISPLGSGLFQAGATYEWDDLTLTPTPAGREKLEIRLRSFLNQPFEVVGHKAGVRPISSDRFPVLGFSADEPRIACFTGLGSKGVLLAPFFAAQLVAAISGTGSVETDVDVKRFPTSGHDKRP